MPLPPHMHGEWIVDDPEHWRLDENFTKLKDDIPDHVEHFKLELFDDGTARMVLGDIMTMIIVFERAAGTSGLFKGHGLVRDAHLDMRGWVALVSLSYTSKGHARLMYTWTKGPVRKTSGYTLWKRKEMEE